ncbi:hypothetical protein [Lysobacter capsici]|uniref:hypothetical protein n=1 Tax=Lysobacter capsici TaxID=435897 RepID=UPI001C003026|nr:hypothetical protein [Lysobacter capsici]MBW8810229.1 hypothetical protein [Lysobacter sp.]QWF17670.1 hypothetical protein KME82_02425 [Lysobacter capsici]
MKNIQVIEPAQNCVYDIFAIDDEGFALIFPEGQDVAFADEVATRHPEHLLEPVFERLWRQRVPKHQAKGIHGLLFCDLDEKKQYYPDRIDEHAINPDGTRLRGG